MVGERERGREGERERGREGERERGREGQTDEQAKTFSQSIVNLRIISVTYNLPPHRTSLIGSQTDGWCRK